MYEVVIHLSSGLIWKCCKIDHLNCLNRWTYCVYLLWSGLDWWRFSMSTTEYFIVLCTLWSVTCSVSACPSIRKIWCIKSWLDLSLFFPQKNSWVVSVLFASKPTLGSHFVCCAVKPRRLLCLLLRCGLLLVLCCFGDVVCSRAEHTNASKDRKCYRFGKKKAQF